MRREDEKVGNLYPQESDLGLDIADEIELGLIINHSLKSYILPLKYI